MYLTPGLYRTSGYGAAIPEDDTELVRQLQVARALVDRHCAVPAGHDFRGGSVTDEQHRWEISNGYAPGTQRIWPDHRPVTSCTSFRIQVTNTQYLDVDTDYVYINQNAHYLEPVIAASSIGVWSYSVVPVAGLRTPVARVSYAYGWSFPVTDEILQPDGGTTYRAANQWWTADTVTVTKNGTALTVSTDYTVDREEGTVTLVATPDYDDVIRASYTHRLPPDIRDAVGIVTTQLLGNRNIVEAGMQGLSGIRVEEVEMRQSRDAEAGRQSITGLAATLLSPYVWKGFA